MQASEGAQLSDSEANVPAVDSEINEAQGSLGGCDHKSLHHRLEPKAGPSSGVCVGAASLDLSE
jgi:hypothetical protein